MKRPLHTCSGSTWHRTERLFSMETDAGSVGRLTTTQRTVKSWQRYLSGVRMLHVEAVWTKHLHPPLTLKTTTRITGSTSASSLTLLSPTSQQIADSCSCSDAWLCWLVLSCETYRCSMRADKAVHTSIYWVWKPLLFMYIRLSPRQDFNNRASQASVARAHCSIKQQVFNWCELIHYRLFPRLTRPWSPSVSCFTCSVFHIFYIMFIIPEGRLWWTGCLRHSGSTVQCLVQ